MPDICREYLKQGRLYCHFDNVVHVMQPWPCPRSWINTASAGWHADEEQANEFLNSRLRLDSEPPAKDPPMPLAVPSLPDHPALTMVLETFGGKVDTTERDTILMDNDLKYAQWVHQHDIYNFFGMIPPEIRRIVASFSERRWHILNLLAHCPGSDELYASNPAMFYLLTCSWKFRHACLSNTTRAARLLVRISQRKMLGWLGFPPTEASRRILAKINSMSLSVDALLKLRDGLSNPAVCKLLGHLPRINSATLWLASDPDTLPHITPRLLAEVADDQDQIVHPHIYRLLCDTLRMAEQLSYKSVSTRYFSIARLLEVHDRLSARIEKVLDDGFGGKQTWEDLPRKFPEPPLKGTVDIVPITTVLELVKEGRSMHNCVSAYSWKVAYGETYIYRVSKPIRATVAIKRNGMRWKLAEVSGVCNEIISENHIERIKRGLFGVDA